MAWISIEFEGSGRRANGKTKGQHGVHTERHSGRVSCRTCGRPVRSRLGSTCSRRRCQDMALHQAGMTDEFGE